MATNALTQDALIAQINTQIGQNACEFLLTTSRITPKALMEAHLTAEDVADHFAQKLSDAFMEVLSTNATINTIWNNRKNGMLPVSEYATILDEAIKSIEPSTIDDIKQL